MDWRDIVDNMYLWYNEFIDWYLVQPIYGQILAIIGIIALLALIVTLIYYIIKGIAYLVYYILKGVYYLLKGIGLLFLKITEGFYHLVSGEKKLKKQPHHDNIQSVISVSNTIVYCSECGKRLSEKMINQMLSQSIVYCVNCGKGLRLIEYQEQSIPTH
ncbi:MAG: hypothetical protein KAX18_09710 [Candidatus Lokiarchaeota archaeon]|nr:hypothetical protein [Candidatus Lokiarchaeota archaeon]